jgi:hypothetical protein
VGTVCQACGYQRMPTDQAPYWECPACGKAYAKTSSGTSVALPDYAVHPTANKTGGNDKPTFWRVVSFVLGVASVPFILLYVQTIIDLTHMTFHPVPPDRVIRLVLKGRTIVYATAAEAARNKWVGIFIIPQCLLILGSGLARIKAKQERQMTT